MPIKVGMPVVLLTNINHNYDLANGSQGTVVDMVQLKDAKLPKVLSHSSHSLDQWALAGEHAVYQEQEIQKFVKRMPDEWLPVVRFRNDVQCTIFPWCEVNDLGTTHRCPPYTPGHEYEYCEEHKVGEMPYNLISRAQLPLLAAWAVTTHKSQGMTLDKAVIDMERAWEHGQMYVAMSRVRSLHGLRVDGVAVGKASRADETVKKFMNETNWVETM